MFLLRQCGARTPSFPFLEKEKRGEKRKSLANRRTEKEHIKFFCPICLGLRSPWGRPPLEERGYAPFFTPHVGNKSCKIFGAIVRIYAYLTGKRVLFPRYERANARSILECVP